MTEASQPPHYRFCSTCGEEHQFGARFCGRCGSALCTLCGATARPGARFCSRCGRTLNPQVLPPAVSPSQPLPSPRGRLPHSHPLHPADTSPWLVEFVNRQETLSAFQGLISGTRDSKRILLLQGPRGVGKSFLLHRLQAECRRAGVAHVRMELADPRGVEDIKIMRDVRDSLGPDEFRLFTDLLNYYTTEGYTLKLQVEVVSRDAQPGGGVVVQGQANVGGVVAGRDAIMIKDNYLSAPRSDIDVDRRRMQDALTRRFLEDLVELSRRRRIVCLFDDVDRLEETTAYWLWRDFLGQMIDHANFVAVLTAAVPLQVERGIYAAMAAPALGNLSEVHVTEYLERRGVPEMHRLGVAGIIMSDIGGHGNPQQMAHMVDIYLKPRSGAIS